MKKKINRTVGNGKNKPRCMSPLSCFQLQILFGTAFTYLTSGVFLSGLAILMGAGDVLVSYLSVIVNICGVLILGFSAFLERFRSRKKLAVILTALSRLAAVFLAAIPALVPSGLQLAVFLPAVLLAFTLQAQTVVVLNQWMLGFLDGRKNGRYISLRQTLTLLVTVLLSLTSGRWMDSMEGSYRGFVLLFLAAGLMGLLEVLMLLRTPDCAAYEPSGDKCSLREMLRLPLRDKSFRGFVLYIFAFYLLLYLADSFTTVYMMKYLQLPYGTITILQMIISLPQVIFLGVWGRISDKRGHAFVLQTSIWLFAGETLFMFFSSSKNWFVFIPIAFLVSSVANSGFVIAVFNRRYELMPVHNRIAYDNFYTAAIGFGFLLGPLAGGAVKGLLEATAADAGMDFIGIRGLYLLSTVGLLLLQLFHSRIARSPGRQAESSTQGCE